MSDITVGFAGMTHLGIVSSAAVASKNFKVICFDEDTSLISRLRDRKLPIVEPDLDDLVRVNGVRQVFTDDITDLQDCDVVYIAPDVPTDDEGKSNLDGIRALINRVVLALNKNAILVVLCQVPPGFTRELKGWPADQLYYQVETLVFGRAVERATKPERYIIGCNDPQKPLPLAFQSVLTAFDCPLLPMRYESAELAKISINCCLVASVSVANTLAELCEKIGADWSEIAPALKLDRRIGAFSYLSPGLGIAGGNLERDLATVLRFADHHGADAGVVSAWVANSRYRRNWAIKTIMSELLNAHEDSKLCIWGLAYKENTHSIKNSPSLATISQLPNKTKLQVTDPIVPGTVVDRALVTYFDKHEQALSGADALLILTPWPQYRNFDPIKIKAQLNGKLVLDPYAVLDERACVSAGLDYLTLGKPPVRALV